MVTAFNHAELATYGQARQLAIKLGAGPIIVGGGVKPENGNNDLSGIYRPNWLPGPGNFPEPHWTDPLTGKRWYSLHFRFNSGFQGMNVGLVREKFKSFPLSPLYVLSVLAAEAGA